MHFREIESGSQGDEGVSGRSRISMHLREIESTQRASQGDRKCISGKLGERAAEHLKETKSTQQSISRRSRRHLKKIEGVSRRLRAF